MAVYYDEGGIVTPEEFADEFRRVARRYEEGVDLTPAMERCADAMLGGVQENFQHARTSEGEKWPPRKDPRPTHPLLILSGVLSAAATHGNVRRVDSESAAVGVSLDAVEYARVHQKGWPERNIAQRAYLGISEEVARKCEGILADNYLAVFNV